MEKMMEQLPHSPRPNTLFHFCKPDKEDEKDRMNGIDKLKSILKNGFFPRYSLENVSAISKTTDRIAFPFVSFCDIPIERLIPHSKFYGCCGIGMDKENWGLGKKLNPVIYINGDTSLSESFKAVFKGAIALNNSHDESEYLESMCKIAAYAKPLNGYAETIQGKNQFKEFYQENEWRYVPINKINKKDIKLYILERDYKKDKERLNKIAEEKACLKFHPNNIRYIFVKTDFDADDLVDFIEDNISDILSDTRNEQSRKHWKKMLFTKIVIFEELIKDI
jgi:hypothetical protein